jgi:hypothetical protein
VEAGSNLSKEMHFEEAAMRLHVIGLLLAAVFPTFVLAQPASRPYQPAVIRDVDDEELARKLLDVENFGRNQPPGALGRLMEITERMHQSAGRLSRQDAGDHTQETQHRIIVELNLLLQELGKGRGSGQEPRSSDSGSSGPAAEGSGGDSPEGSKGSKLAGMATTRLASQTLHESGMEQMNLPARDRRAILNGMKHGSLPEYREMISKYYQALAEIRQTKQSP